MSSNLIKVSILVPIYNAEHYIERCAQSLFNQTYGNIEYVFVDDGSSDKSADVLMSVLKGFPSRAESCRFIRNERNQGISYTRNVLLENASGEYVIWVDSDDWIDEQMVELLVDQICDNIIDVVFCGIKVHFSRGGGKDVLPNMSNNPKEILISMLKRNTRSNIAAKMWKRTLYYNHHLAFPVGYNSGEDSYINLQLMYYSKCVKNVPLCLYHYDCTREGSATDSQYWNENKYNKGWHVFKLIKNFFQNKGYEYLDALKVWEIKTASENIIMCISNNLPITLYKRIFNEHIDLVEKKYWRNVSFLKRIPFYIRNYYIVKYYIYFMRWGKHFLLKQNVR